MFCTECGQSVTPGSPFCPNCGAPNVPDSGDAARSTPPQTPLPQSPPPNYNQAPPSSGQMTPQYPQGGYGGGYGGGYPPQYPPPQYPGKPNHTALIVGIVAAAIVLLAALGVGLYFGLRDKGSDDTTAASDRTTTTETSTSEATTTTEEVFEQKAGEIFLEPVGTPGPDAFAGEIFITTGPTTTLHLPVTTLPATTTTVPTGSTTTAAGVQVASVAGDTPALYGGSKDKAIADKEGQLTFLEQNPEKAAAFCEALNNDPTFRWSGGTQIQPSQLRAYFEELTPLMLTRDTRVTNHGYRNGHPTPRQSVLQKGQMVLVDQYGVPRVRCECGNPLIPPKPVQTTPVYTGPKWPDFDPTTIIVIQPTTIIIDIFVIVDIDTGDLIDRPSGTEGIDDIAHVSVWQLDVSMGGTDDWEHNCSIDWSGAVTLNEDGTLTGEGAGLWHVSGPWYAGDEVAGSMTADGGVSVGLSGQLDATEMGDMLTIFPLMEGYTIDGQTWNPASSDAQDDFESAIESLLASSFTTSMQLEPTTGTVYADLAVDMWVGSATLYPYEP